MKKRRRNVCKRIRFEQYVLSRSAIKRSRREQQGLFRRVRFVHNKEPGYAISTDRIIRATVP